MLLSFYLGENYTNTHLEEGTWSLLRDQRL